MEQSHQTIKYSLRAICKEGDLMTRILENVSLVDRIITEGYHLLNLHILRLLGDVRDIPPLTAEYLLRFLHAVSFKTNKQGKKTKPDSDIEETRKLLVEHNNNKEELVCRDGLVEPLRSAAVEMATAIKNNIQMHFFKIQYWFLRNLHPEKDKTELLAFQNLLNETRDVFGEGARCLPSKIDKSVAYDLEADPFKFLVPMYHMNTYLESKGARTFSLLPMRRGFIPRSIHITTDALFDWVCKDSKAADYKRFKKDALSKAPAVSVGTGKATKRKRDSGEGMEKSKSRRKIPEEEACQVKDLLWDQYLDFSRFQCGKKYRFAHHITTDGVSVSVLFKRKKIPNVQKPRKKRQRKEAATLHSTADQHQSSLPDCNNRVVVGLDPGKHSILYMTSDDTTHTLKPTNRLQYTNIQRKVECGGKVKIAKPREVGEAETVLSTTNSRSMSVEGYLKYIQARHQQQALLYKHYQTLDHRVIRWWKYRKRQQSESTLVGNIKEKFGKDPVIAYGSWSRTTQMRGLIPSPVIGMQKLLAKHFDVVVVPEYNTTQTCSKCMKGKMCEVLKRPCPRCKSLQTKVDSTEVVLCKRCKRKGQQKMEDVRGLRRCNNEDCAVYMNRDYNAAMNIRCNLLHYVNTGQWHPSFRPSSG